MDAPALLEAISVPLAEQASKVAMQAWRELRPTSSNEQKRSFRCLIDHARGLRLPTHKAMESRSYESSDGTDHSHGYEEVCEPTQWCSRASRVRAAGAG